MLFICVGLDFQRKARRFFLLLGENCCLKIFGLFYKMINLPKKTVFVRCFCKNKRGFFVIFSNKNMVNIFWFRRDLRLEDNAGLYHALQNGEKVIPIFIFDTNILERLSDKTDARVSFLHQTVTELNEQLTALGSGLFVRHGEPQAVIAELLQQFSVAKIFANHDDEPYALQRDAAVRTLLQGAGAAFETFKDHVIFERKEVVKDDGTPYTVFTPYSKKWRKLLESQLEADGTSYFLKPYPTERYFSNFEKMEKSPLLSLESMGFEPTTIPLPAKTVEQSLIKAYDTQRNFPAKRGTSRLGLHFRFGTISIREKARKAQKLNDTFLSELIWRDFYAQILANFPHVATAPFREKYAAIKWRNEETEFQKWCEGKTGYPIVDAGMRELNATGFMHNRVRMITASFLTKHLLIDWRWGEAYFAEKLLDFDLASNNGGWQWAAGCGTDAAPYFRIFNPASQQDKFDKDFSYVRKWVTEYGTLKYPQPMVEHKLARERCLATYKAGLESS
jgi:deoxyribodipyrimidine photo-lyase